MKKKPEMMGFEDNKRIVKVMRNRASTEVVGGKTCHFRSQLEYKWAQYLQFLKDNDKVIDWEFEPKTFDFQGKGYVKGPFMYLPDFKVVECHGCSLCKPTIIWQECKGYHDGDTNSKLRRMAQCYPDETMELVLQRIPKKGGHKGAGRRRIAAKYVRRIIDASEIFKQMKGLL